jgi:nucleoid DNA-binding protein
MANSNKQKNVTKRAFANTIAEKVGITQEVAFKTVKATLAVLADILANDGHVELRGFGVFETIVQRPRVGRNPKNPQVTVQIPARKVVKFRAGRDLAAKVEKLAIKPEELGK